jgi:beta-lactam-binding protein with PASTA domain
VPDCPVCAFANPPDAPRCGNCGADLRPDVVDKPVVPYAPVTGPARFAAGTPSPRSAPAATPSGGGPPPSSMPSSSAPSGKRREADLALEPTSLEVAPGSSVPATITVHNLGDEVEHFRIEVNGPAGAFARADPPELRMTKGGKGTAVIRFSPARRPEQPAGPQAFQVVARSTVNSDVAPRAQGTVDVGPFAEIHAELVPEVTRGRRPGAHRLELVNGGNQPTTLLVELRDKDNELVFEPRSFDDRLAPGERTEQSFTVCGPRPWFGRTQSLPFTATVEAPGVPQPVRLDGTRRQVPRLPWWIPTVALALVGILLAVWALLPKATLPNVVGLTQAAAVKKLEDSGYKSVAIPQVNDTATAGEVFDTSPKAGSNVKDDEFVSLFVSRGKCEGDCPPLVPDVGLLPVAAAVTQLERATLRPTEDRIADAQVPAGRVIRTSPEANSPAPDRTVTVFVSDGTGASASDSSSGSETGTSAATGPGTSSGGQTSTPPVSSTAGGGGGGSGGGALFMPSVAGSLLADALRKLKTLAPDLQITQTMVRTSSKGPGTIVDTQPKSGDPITASTPVTVRVAAPNINLIALAPQAEWEVADVVTTFPFGADDAPAAGRTEPAVPDDPDGEKILITTPGMAEPIAARFGLGEDKVLTGDRVYAEAVFTEGEVTFGVRAAGKDLGSLVPEADSGEGFRRLALDLSGAVDASDIEIVVGATEGTGSKQVRWNVLRIEGQSE